MSQAGHENRGLLLVNLGTPDSPEPQDVGNYLAEFLMDPLVITAPTWLRFLLVRGLIVPRRKFASAKLYRKIWTEEGSPLLVYGKRLARGVQSELGWPVALGMRYGNPSIRSAIENLESRGISELVVLPLYPQFAKATTESTLREVRRVIGDRLPIRCIDPFFDRREFARGFKEVFEKYAAAMGPFDHYLMSYHGLPEKQIKEMAPSCLKTDCCKKWGESNRNCYRAQCFETTRRLVGELNLDAEKVTTAFQSRLGPTRWIQPYTDQVVEDLAKRGVRRLAVFCPSFVADCLETLEEIEIRLNETFQAAGGENLFLVPSLNAESSWAKGVASWVLSEKKGCFPLNSN